MKFDPLIGMIRKNATRQSTCFEVSKWWI